MVTYIHITKVTPYIVEYIPYSFINTKIEVYPYILHYIPICKKLYIPVYSGVYTPVYSTLYNII